MFDKGDEGYYLYTHVHACKPAIVTRNKIHCSRFIICLRLVDYSSNRAVLYS